ncbi:MAG: translation initiation factor IF-3 [Bacteroidetes bacterium]|nr:translation initiation factor IF-3 [Bacteroidota bacterium]
MVKSEQSENKQAPVVQNRFLGFRRPPIKEVLHKINDKITADPVRLVGENVEQGIISLQEAIEIAEEKGLDLVEISPKATPPVCRIVDYNKFLYDQKKKAKELKANSTKTEIKEIRFGPNTDEHDIDFKTKHAMKFLGDGHKVRAYVFFKGRTIIYQDRGFKLLNDFSERLTNVAKVEMEPKLEGKKLYILLSPKVKK